MATTLITVHCKLFQMIPYIIILKLRKLHEPTASHFSTAMKKPVGGGGAELTNFDKFCQIAELCEFEVK